MNKNSTTDAGLEAGRARLAQDIAAITDEAAELLKQTGEHNLRRAQQALSKARTAIRSGGNDAAEATGEYVLAHPLKALGFAAAAGLVVGVFLARR